jgi:hypothetical protein
MRANQFAAHLCAPDRRTHSEEATGKMRDGQLGLSLGTGSSLKQILQDADVLPQKRQSKD